MAHWSLGDLPVHKNWIELGSVVFVHDFPWKPIYPLFKFTFESMMVFFFPQVGYGSSFLRFRSWPFRHEKLLEKNPRLRVFWGGKKRWFNPWILCQFYRKMEGSWRNLRSGQISNFWHEGFEGFFVWFSCIIASCIIFLESHVFFLQDDILFFPFDSLDRNLTCEKPRTEKPFEPAFVIFWVHRMRWFLGHPKKNLRVEGRKKSCYGMQFGPSETPKHVVLLMVQKSCT